MSKEELFDNIHRTLVDSTYESDSYYKLNMLSNRNEAFLYTITDLLKECDEFYFSVAFINDSGLRGLLVTLDEVNASGQVIVGNKQNFSEPKAIKKLNSYKNIEVKIDMSNDLHTKGYFFRKGNIWTIVVGSSNLTISALKTNKEWNFIIDSFQNSGLVNEAINEFKSIWKDAIDVDIVINEYERQYNSKRIVQYWKDTEIKPNSMQKDALLAIQKMRDEFDKALIISATGTGKTYLSAFDVKKIKPKRLLFIVHRESIAIKAKETFESIIKDKTMGLYTGNQKDDAQYLFTTIQTISKEGYLATFKADEFDYIIIDEVHHAGAKSYQRVIDYFNPKFLLGMSATPERMDDFNIYDLFDYNIAYEIRLNNAIDNELIVPFHYYGVSEVRVNGNVIDEKTKVSMKEKAINIKKKSEHYGYCGNKVRGLIFVDNVENAKALEAELNDLNYRAKALSSLNSEEQRYNAIKLLENNQDNDNYLDFIITVDIFNEGIDIPCVNQVILLRATQSIIVYVQQLGRGLRKYDKKEYLVVLDFIGNYKNNFMIPAALLDNQTYDVNQMNMFIENGTNLAAGQCTINFESITKNLIYDKISSKSLSSKKIIMENYKQLKQRLNRLPLLFDFYESRLISPEYILEYKKTYYEVVNTFENEEIYKFSEYEANFLRFMYQEYTFAKRVHELIILIELLNGNNDIKVINKIIEDKLNIGEQLANTKNAWDNLAINILQLDNNRKKYKPLIINDNIDVNVLVSYQKNYKFKELVDDVLKLNFEYIKDNYPQLDVSPLLLHHIYSRKEAFVLSNFEYNPGYQVSGYVKASDNKTVMIFMRADNSVFVNDIFYKSEIIFYSKSNRELFKEGKSQLESDIALNKYMLKVFMKKKDKELDYYLGEAKVIEYEQIKLNGKKVIKYKLKLSTPIESKVYRYLKE